MSCSSCSHHSRCLLSSPSWYFDKSLSGNINAFFCLSIYWVHIFCTSFTYWGVITSFFGMKRKRIRVRVWGLGGLSDVWVFLYAHFVCYISWTAVLGMVLGWAGTSITLDLTAWGLYSAWTRQLWIAAAVWDLLKSATWLFISWRIWLRSGGRRLLDFQQRPRLSLDASELWIAVLIWYIGFVIPHL